MISIRRNSRFALSLRMRNGQRTRNSFGATCWLRYRPSCRSLASELNLIQERAIADSAMPPFAATYGQAAASCCRAAGSSLLFLRRAYLYFPVSPADRVRLHGTAQSTSPIGRDDNYCVPVSFPTDDSFNDLQEKYTLGLALRANRHVKRLSTLPKGSLISRLTLQSASRQIELRMNARSPFPANKRSDDSDLA
jgi:hypothetical protein